MSVNAGVGYGDCGPWLARGRRPTSTSLTNLSDSRSGGRSRHGAECRPTTTYVTSDNDVRSISCRHSPAGSARMTTDRPRPMFAGAKQSNVDVDEKLAQI